MYYTRLVVVHLAKFYGSADVTAGTKKPLSVGTCEVGEPLVVDVITKK